LPRTHTHPSPPPLPLLNFHFLPPQAALYAAWLIGGLSFGYIKNEIIEPKFASGEWQNLQISLPFFSDKSDAAVVEAVSSVSQAAQTVDAVIQQSSDIVS
jgi:hypothetical protein